MFAQDFKSCGSAYGGSVGSTPTHFRHFPAVTRAEWKAVRHDSGTSKLCPSTMSPRKPPVFKKTTEVKRQARLRVGSPPAAQTHQDRRKKLPKHKKREKQDETDQAGS